jgi:hypothetical protein
MKIKQIERWVEEIREIAHDCEAAHTLEDDLYEAFIEYVASNGAKDLKKKAKLILTTKQIDFPRYTS